MYAQDPLEAIQIRIDKLGKLMNEDEKQLVMNNLRICSYDDDYLEQFSIQREIRQIREDFRLIILDSLYYYFPRYEIGNGNPLFKSLGDIISEFKAAILAVDVKDPYAMTFFKWQGALMKTNKINKVNLFWRTSYDVNPYKPIQLQRTEDGILLPVS